MESTDVINAKHAKKRDILIEMQESGMTLVQRDFLPIRDNVDTYAIQ